MNKIYTSGNYIIIEEGGEVKPFPKSSSQYNEYNDHYLIKKFPDKEVVHFSFSDVGSWFNQDGTLPFTKQSLLTFLRENTFLQGVAGGVSLATETTAQGILNAVTQTNNILTQDTNNFLSEIRDSNAVQQSLLAASNTLISDIKLELQSLNSSGDLSNENLANILSGIIDVEDVLGNMNTNDISFYSSLSQSQSDIILELQGIDFQNTITASRLQNLINQTITLLGQTDQLESLLTTINNNLDLNRNTNAASLEQLRLLLVGINTNTDDLENQLATVISEHDQTQVAIATQQAALSSILTNQLNILLNLNNELTGAVKEGFVMKVENGGSGTINNVQNVSFVFSGTDDGRLNNIEVPDGFNTSFIPNKSSDLIEEIDYQAPQTGFILITGING